MSSPDLHARSANSAVGHNLVEQLDRRVGRRFLLILDRDVLRASLSDGLQALSGVIAWYFSEDTTKEIRVRSFGG